MRKVKGVVCALFLCFLIVSPVWGHDYWILPETFCPAQNSIVEVAFTCGHSYFDPAETPDNTRYRLFLTNPRGREIPIAYSRINSKAAWALVPVHGPGTYIISGVNTLPAFWSETPDGWKPKRKSQVKKAIKTGKTYKFTKTFLTVGRSSDSYRKPLGHIVEIVPQADPTALKACRTLTVLFLYEGKPVKDVSVYGLCEDFKKDDQPVETKTDKNGLARLKLDRPGKWLIGARYEFDTPGNPDADYEYHLAYLMFEIKK
ncbi:MAG: DUF4198 domain-containing protein [Thermodesulfobacteriota bacterium]|nr:DUF4198 domain-containing protein [Thermodesulfobacteriota bacterium]